jgi:hypothetical protein
MSPSKGGRGSSERDGPFFVFEKTLKYSDEGGEGILIITKIIVTKFMNSPLANFDSITKRMLLTEKIYS